MNRFRFAFQRLRSAAYRIANNEGGGSFLIIMDALWCFVRYGMTPNEYLGWNVWKLSGRERQKYYTARDSAKYEPLFNPEQYRHFFDNKVDFNRKFHDFVRRDWIYSAECTEEEITNFIMAHDKVIIKPIGLSSGRGIFVMNKEKYVNWGGKSDMTNCLIEEFIQQHPDMARLNPSSVNSIRIYTLRKRDGTPLILSASVRVGGKGAEVDNYHAGGVGYPIDVESGIIYICQEQGLMEVNISTIPQPMSNWLDSESRTGRLVNGLFMMR